MLGEQTFYFEDEEPEGAFERTKDWVADQISLIERRLGKGKLRNNAV